MESPSGKRQVLRQLSPQGSPAALRSFGALPGPVKALHSPAATSPEGADRAEGSSRARALLDVDAVDPPSPAAVDSTRLSRRMHESVGAMGVPAALGCAAAARSPEVPALQWVEEAPPAVSVSVEVAEAPSLPCTPPLLYPNLSPSQVAAVLVREGEGLALAAAAIEARARKAVAGALAEVAAASSEPAACAEAHSSEAPSFVPYSTSLGGDTPSCDTTTIQPSPAPASPSRVGRGRAAAVSPHAGHPVSPALRRLLYRNEGGASLSTTSCVGSITLPGAVTVLSAAVVGPARGPSPSVGGRLNPHFESLKARLQEARADAARLAGDVDAARVSAQAKAWAGKEGGRATRLQLSPQQKPPPPREAVPSPPSSPALDASDISIIADRSYDGGSPLDRSMQAPPPTPTPAREVEEEAPRSRRGSTALSRIAARALSRSRSRGSARSIVGVEGALPPLPPRTDAQGAATALLVQAAATVAALTAQLSAAASSRPPSLPSARGASKRGSRAASVSGGEAREACTQTAELCVSAGPPGSGEAEAAASPAEVYGEEEALLDAISTGSLGLRLGHAERAVPGGSPSAPPPERADSPHKAAPVPLQWDDDWDEQAQEGAVGPRRVIAAPPEAPLPPPPAAAPHHARRSLPPQGSRPWMPSGVTRGLGDVLDKGLRVAPPTPPAAKAGTHKLRAAAARRL